LIDLKQIFVILRTSLECCSYGQLRNFVETRFFTSATPPKLLTAIKAKGICDGFRTGRSLYLQRFARIFVGTRFFASATSPKLLPAWKAESWCRGRFLSILES